LEPGRFSFPTPSRPAAVVAGYLVSVAYLTFAGGCPAAPTATS
jgi:hypothetical protein